MFGNLNYDRLFFSRKTATAFGFAAALSIGLLVLRQVDIDLNRLSRPALVGLSLVGAAVACGALLLLAGMWLYWVKSDVSPKWQRVAWFFVLLFGFFYGAVIYYLIVYLPGVKKALDHQKESDDIRHKPDTPLRIKSMMTWCGRLLCAGWMLFVFSILALFVFPKPITHLIDDPSFYLKLTLICLLFGSAVFALLFLFRAGMKRTK